MIVLTDHPVRAYQRMPSAISFDGTATSPVPGGDYPFFEQQLHRRIEKEISDGGLRISDVDNA